MRNLFLSFLAIVPLSCGSPKSLVRVVNKAEGVTTTVNTSVGAGGSTTVTVTPSIQVDSTQIL